MGWASGSSVCFAQESDAANAFCASDTGNGCQMPVEASGAPLANGAQGWAFQYASGVATTTKVYHLQPCQRLDWQSYGPIFGAGVLFLVAVVCARSIQNLFKTHA